MNSLRKILFPFSLIYGAITWLRNRAFDSGVFPSTSFDIPVIAVGNLNVGGTGKSPMIEYLIRLLKDSVDLAVLSRGYGRKSKGFYKAFPDSTAADLGDEPFQFYRKFSDLTVVVDEKRVHGINRLLQLDKPEVVLLDDAFQHRQIKAGFYILLTAYGKLYPDDMVLPAGNLREPKGGAKRADIIVVSKCPLDLSIDERKLILEKINPEPHQNVFFSGIRYDNFVYDQIDKVPLKEVKDWHILLVTGIADSAPLARFLSTSEIDFDHLAFSDHQFIGDQELKKIKDRFSNLSGEKKAILTTEKDYVRSFLDVPLPVYYLPIRTEMIEDADIFNELIQNYVRKN